jgi:MFS family permease
MTTTNPWVVFAVASASVFLVSVDATIAVAAFPALRLSFSEASPSDLSWVLNAYTILYAALLVPAGRLVDLHGSRRLFLIGVALFTLASAACGMAPGTGSLIAARIVQAVGGAILTPASLALILGAFPPEKRTAIVGMWSGVGALGAAVGPGAGGILIELATWRAAFLVNLPFGALIVWFAWRRLPMLGGAARGEGLDLVGIGLIVAGVSSLTYGIVQIESFGLAAPIVWAPAATGAILLIGYGLWARGRRNAAIDMALFEDRTYALVTLATFVFGLGFAMMFLTSFLFLLGIWGFGQGLTGLAGGHVRSVGDTRRPSWCDRDRWGGVCHRTTLPWNAGHFDAVLSCVMAPASDHRRRGNRLVARRAVRCRSCRTAAGEVRRGRCGQQRGPPARRRHRYCLCRRSDRPTRHPACRVSNSFPLDRCAQRDNRGDRLCNPFEKQTFQTDSGC